MLSTLINVWLLNFWCGHWTTVVSIELLRGYWTNEKLICTCSPTLVLTKGTKAHQRNVSSTRLIVYTAHFIRAGLDFQDRVPILSVLGLPLDMVRARVKFWSGTDGAKSLTRLNLSVPNQFVWYAYFFRPSRAKIFCRVNGALVRGTFPKRAKGVKRPRNLAISSVLHSFTDTGAIRKRTILKGGWYVKIFKIRIKPFFHIINQCISFYFIYGLFPALLSIPQN